MITILQRNDRSKVITDGISVFKEYSNHEVNLHSSVDNEVYFSNLVKSDFVLPCSKIDNKTVKMPLGSYALGDTKELNKEIIRNMLFYISKSDVLNQLDELLHDLTLTGIEHRDINPGNLIFFRESKYIKLIDFYWAKHKNEETKYNPKELNKHYSWDDATSLLNIKYNFLTIANKIDKEISDSLTLFREKIGIHLHNGSSTVKGKSYHPVSVIGHEFAIKPQKKAAFLEYNHAHKLFNKTKIKSIVDIGAATGFFTFNALRHLHPKTITAFEADPTNFKLLNDIKTIYRLHNLKLSEAFTPKSKIPNKTHITLMLNVHMWLWKAYGEKGVDKIMRNIQQRTKYLLFQTAHAESGGRYRVDKLKTKEDIINYLASFGYDKITLVATTGAHKGIRYMFLCENF
ncbi:MAG TPA: hypothetical protein PLQ68_07905 [Clostridia bacterium]|nr:hypothetical protein [Clostridia bacterium]